jgi:cytochrome c oxidase subunit 2
MVATSRLVEPVCLVTLSSAFALSGCSGEQSALDPAGEGAERLAALFWWMAAGSMLIWAGFVALSLHAVYGRRSPHTARGARLLILVGGIVFPTVVLTGLLSYGLSILPGLLAKAPAGSLRIAVVGEQWWWRVRYLAANGQPIDLANELRLPIGEPVEFELESRDVIHSFWIPSLGGKMDMIPGRRTRLRLTPTRLGTFRGACAEYCGSSHALMSFTVRVLAQDEFARWFSAQMQAAATPTEPAARRGGELFLENGCGACHTVRGTLANGTLGPDLTHVGSRGNIGAGLLGNTPDEFTRWLRDTAALKPGVTMPHFGMLSGEDLKSLAAYLEALQ